MTNERLLPTKPVKSEMREIKEAFPLAVSTSLVPKGANPPRQALKRIIRKGITNDRAVKGLIIFLTDFVFI